MANSINSISSGTGGLQSTADGTSGNLLIQKDAGTIATFSSTGVVVSGVVAATTLTGDGSALTGISSGGLTQLASFATTSGTTVVSPTLDLSTYKTLIVEFWSCSPDTTEDTSIRWANTGGTAQKLGVNGTNASQGYYGRVTHDLVNKYVWTNVFNRDQADLDGTLFMSGAEVSLGVNNQITTSTTSITFDWYSGQDFDGGSILIYGLK
jgi:hypothetical protein